ncbi:unnamed protein product [Bursaphelenchus xylophilus]|uniref:(pine wood nematode) hypothetical protein n=1 Tax=Bursaphelenchus xylophilus TaxID=6326 RepID=A0A1I7RHG1_BURXY|nr:unnamed protein product [Bursaphelenchus xylophilus]CAG9115778.1 unnamed protein product [Bursaphelenchus xylophilus]
MSEDGHPQPTSSRQPFKVSLIQFVRGHPELWDLSMPAYRNNTLKSTIWEKFISRHPGVNSKQVREQWRLIKNRYYQERELRQSGKEMSTDFPYFEDCHFLENGKSTEGTPIKTRKFEENKDFLDNFKRILSEASLEEEQANSPQSDNDLENSAPNSHNNNTPSADRSKAPAETRAHLIDLVKDLPELYDKSNPLYKNNAHKGVLWSRIAKQLGNGATAKKVREQWSYMRRKYEEEFYSRKSGQAPTPMDPSKRHLFTFDQLSFLENYMQSERPESPPDNENQEAEADSSDNNQPDDSFGFKSSNINDLLLQLSQAASTRTPTSNNNNGRINMATGEILYDDKPTTSGPASINFDDVKGARPKKRRLDEVLPGVGSIDKTDLQKTVNDLSRCLLELLPSKDEDECSLFGKQIAHDLRRLSLRSRLVARKKINDLLMEMVIQDINEHVSTPTDELGATSNGNDI